jgi:hypothetical protein
MQATQRCAMRSILLTILFLTACSGVPPVPTRERAWVIRTVVITALDPVTKQDISPINVWDDPEQRTTIVGKVKTGDEVGLIEERNGAVRIRLIDGKRGWISEVFIEELEDGE